MPPDEPIPLSQLTKGQSGEIVSLSGEPALLQRFGEFGLFEGEVVEFLGTAPLGDPIEIRLGHTRLTLRKAEAAGVIVRRL